MFSHNTKENKSPDTSGENFSIAWYTHYRHVYDIALCFESQSAPKSFEIII